MVVMVVDFLVLEGLREEEEVWDVRAVVSRRVELLADSAICLRFRRGSLAVQEALLPVAVVKSSCEV